MPVIRYEKSEIELKRLENRICDMVIKFKGLGVSPDVALHICKELIAPVLFLDPNAPLQIPEFFSERIEAEPRNLDA